MAPKLSGKGNSTDTLFIFARSMINPPVPVAIVGAAKQVRVVINRELP